MNVHFEPMKFLLRRESYLTNNIQNITQKKKKLTMANMNKMTFIFIMKNDVRNKSIKPWTMIKNKISNTYVT
jgi:hypothetical protein